MKKRFLFSIFLLLLLGFSSLAFGFFSQSNLKFFWKQTHKVVTEVATGTSEVLLNSVRAVGEAGTLAIQGGYNLIFPSRGTTTGVSSLNIMAQKRSSLSLSTGSSSGVGSINVEVPNVSSISTPITLSEVVSGGLTSPTIEAQILASSSFETGIGGVGSSSANFLVLESFVLFGIPQGSEGSVGTLTPSTTTTASLTPLHPAVAGSSSSLSVLTPVTYTVVLSGTSWTAPSVGLLNNTVTVELWGGGGTGGPATGNTAGAGGGAGGQYAKKTFTVTPGQTYSYSIAAASTSSTSSVVNGNDSTFNTNTVVAKGGAGGSIASSAGGTSNGGVGSTTGGIGDTVYAGGNGGNGVSSSISGGGGGGAGSTGTGNSASGSTPGAAKTLNGGIGGTGVSVANTRNAGGNYGAGASGGLSSSNTDRSGGNGAPGYGLITYTITPVFAFTNISGAGVNGSYNNPSISIGSAGPTMYATSTNKTSTFNTGALTSRKYSGQLILTGTHNIARVDFWANAKGGSLTGKDYYVSIYSRTGTALNLSTGLKGTSSVIHGADITVGMLTFNFSPAISTTTGDAIVLYTTSAADSTNYLGIGTGADGDSSYSQREYYSETGVAQGPLATEDCWYQLWE